MKQYNLTKEIKDNNKTLFLDTNKKYGILTDDILSAMGDTLFECPASTMLDLHNACEGGLVDHILRVAKYAANINKFLPEFSKQEVTSIIKVAFIAELGKIGLYEKETSDWHIKNMGRIYNFKKDVVSMRVTERSLYLANQYGIQLKDYEFSAIANYDKDDSDKQSYWHGDILGIICKMANRLAIEEEKTLFAIANK